MACPLPVQTRFVAGVFAGFRRVRGAAEAGPDSLEFESLEGFGALAGFSTYRPTGNEQDDADPSAPWNAGIARKYTRRAISGTAVSEGYTEENGGGELICYLPGYGPFPAAHSFGARWTGAAVFVGDTLAAFAQKEGRSYYATFGDPNVGACSMTWTAPTDVSVCDYGAPGHPDFLVTDTVRILRGAGIFNAPPESLAQARSTDHRGEVVETLSVPDSFFAAIERAGGAVAGTASETLPGWIDTTYPGSLAPIPFTDCRAVRVTAGFSRLQVGHSYTLRAWYRLRGLDGRDDSSRSADVAYTPAASSVSIPHDLPVMDGYAVSLVALRLLP